MAQDSSRPAQRSHCRKKGQLRPGKVGLTPDLEPPQLLPQMAGEKKQNKYPSETGLFPTTCYNTRTKCSLCSKTVMSSTRGGGEHVPKPHIISPAGSTHLCRCSGHQGVWEGRDRPRGRVQPVGTCFGHHRQIPLQLLRGYWDLLTLQPQVRAAVIQTMSAGGTRAAQTIQIPQSKPIQVRNQTQRGLSAPSWNNGCLGKLDSGIVLITSVSTL